MVASNFRGLSSRVTTIFFSLPLLDSSFISVWFKEKKAISEPEIKAELIRSRMNTIPFKKRVKSKEANSKNKGSGSGSKV